MGKKIQRKSASAGSGEAPQAAQLDAIRKLLREGRFDTAFQRADALRAKYPRCRPLLALCWEAADSAGSFSTATMHAWDWTQAAPGSLAALEALRESSFAAGFAALGSWAIQKLAQARGEPEPALPPLEGPLGAMTFSQAVTNDLSCLYLRFARFDDAIVTLRDEDHPAMRNNRVLAYFAKGDIAAALADIEANWQRDKRNLFALHHLVRLRLWTGEHAAAHALLGHLRDSEPQRAEDAYGKIWGLLLLGDHAQVLATWRAVARAEYWSDFTCQMQSACAHLAGLAAWCLGDHEQAGECFEEAFDLDPDNADAEEANYALEFGEFAADADPKAGDFRDWLPASWVAEYQSAKGEAARDAVVVSQCGRCDAHADYLAVVAELGGPAVRYYALEILKTRAQGGDASAVATLLHLLTRPCGPDRVRTELDVWLKEKGFVEAGRPQAVLIKGEVQELELLPVSIHAKHTDLGLPPQLQTRQEQMHRLIAKKDLRGASRIAEELLAARPDLPIFIGYVATLKEALGGALDEIEALFKRAAELDPDYLFAQVGLAKVALRRGDAERAKDLLAPLRRRGEYHFTEWRALLIADLALAEAELDLPRVSMLKESLRALEREFAR